MEVPLDEGTVMNTSTLIGRLTVTGIGLAVVAVLSPAASAQDTDSADRVTDRKVETAECLTTNRAAVLVTAQRDDIARAVEDRKVRYAQYRLAHALELASNR